jgi:hypothetical protein
MLNLVPKWPFVAGALVLGLLGGAGGMRVWDKGTIDDLKVDLANVKSKNAQDVANASQTALKDLADASKAIKEAASTGQANFAGLNAKLDTLARKYNAKPPAPLPVDCRPGTERVRNLSESAAAVNASIARPIPGK